MASVLGEKEILLNGVRYPITVPVRKTLTSIFAPKITIGDTTRDSEQRASSVAFNDFRGGIGWHTGLDSTTFDRAWYSTCQTRYKGHLILPRKTESVNSPNGKITNINTFNNTIFVSASSNIYKLNANSASFSSSVQNMSADASDSIVAQVEQKPYLIYATNSAQGLWYSADGASFNQVSASTLDFNGGHLVPKFFTYWQDKLYVLAEPSGGGVATQQARLFYYDTSNQASINFSIWQPDAYVPAEAGDVTAMFIGRDVANNPIIYLNTTKGLFVHDDANTRIIETEVGLPFQPDAGKGSVKWRDAIYFGVGTGVYKYQVGDPSTLSVVGPDRDHGLPQNYQGTIISMVGSHNDLLIALDGKPGDEGSTLFSGSGNVGSQVHGGSTVLGDAGFSSILGWNTRGWEFKWAGTESGDNVVNMHISNAPAEPTTDESYKLYWNSSSKLFYQKLERNIVNPDQLATYEYQTNTASEVSGYSNAAGIHETPWFDADDNINDKLALSMIIEGRKLSSTSRIRVSYALNHDDSQGDASTFTTLASITSNGPINYPFPDATAVGVSFSSIKFKFELLTTSENTSPDMVRAEFRFRKKLKTKYGFQANIDMTFKGKTYKGKTRQQLKDNLETAIENNLLVKFRYKPADDASESDYLTEISSVSGFDMSGRDDRKQVTIQLVEP
mgnify:FL=1